MKTKALIHLAGIFLLTVVVVPPARGEDVLSVHSLVSENHAVLIPEVEGLWEIDIFDIDTVEFRQAGDNFYGMVLTSSGRSSEFEATFTRIGDELILDIFPKTADSHNFVEEYYQDHQLPLHSFVRVQLTGDTLRLASPTYRWFYDNIIAKQPNVDYFLSDTRLILNVSTNGLRTYLKEHVKDTGFFEDATVARRIADKPHNQTEVDRRRIGDIRPARVENDPPSLLPNGAPSFPYKDGWLGGDGGVAVPISSAKTVWLFGDTYVGRKDQTTRQGAAMVTTIGVGTRGADGVMDMQYFWHDMYSDHPDHFFQSHTNRYKFWPLDGFMYDGNLYVIMSKIGPLPGLSPDNIFNFSVIGLTLAKVTDPAVSSPRDWQIDFIPWSHALDAGQYQGGLAKDDKFVYLFMAKGGKQNFLVRLPLAKLESPDSSVEYFSRDETWKFGIDSSDAKVLFEDPLIGRANYIPELKEWLVVYGPYFGEDAIYFRTAPELVGPWSDRQVLYKCPELVKGTPQYDENNFCYCSRVMTTTFDKGIFRLLLTYTCNSSKQAKTVENMAIYTPQVVEVSLPK